MLVIALGFTACKTKAKDADIKSAIEAALKADPMSAGTLVSVDKGIATISGECKEEACKTHCADLVKGVNEVVDNISIDPPVVNADDEALNKGLTDALKDHPGV